MLPSDVPDWIDRSTQIVMEPVRMESIKPDSHCPLCLRFNDDLRKLRETVLTQVERAMEEVREIADKESDRVEGIRKALQGEVAELEARLVEKDEVLRAKNRAIQELKVEFDARIHSLQERLEELHMLLQARDDELVENRSVLASKDIEIGALKSDLLEKKRLLAKFEKDAWRSLGKNWRWKVWRNGSHG